MTEALTTRLSSEALWDRLRPELTSPAGRPLLLYVHVPFCSTKCVFCDWVREIPASRLRAGGDVRGRYVDALVAQIRHHGRHLVEAGYSPRLIYWGGGTPTRLSVDEIAAIGRALQETVGLDGIEEYTIECSPETVTTEKLRTLAAHGATRLSIGVQSFDDEELRRGGRAHSAEQIRASVACAKAAGFRDFNLDVIAGFPGQTTATLIDSVRRTIDLDPSHVTVYVYRATAGTAMAEQVRQGRRAAGDYQVMLASYHAARKSLQASGYHEYAIGYFTRDAKRPCRADQYYFSIEGDYFGFGAGAHSIVAHHFFENLAAEQDVFLADPCGFAGCERFSLTDFTRLFASLRQTLWIPDGIIFDRFERLYGVPFQTVAAHPHLQAFMRYYELCGAKFERTATRWRVTEDTMVPAYIRALSLYGTQNEGRSVALSRAPDARPGHSVGAP